MELDDHLNRTTINVWGFFSSDYFYGLGILLPGFLYLPQKPLFHPSYLSPYQQSLHYNKKL